jgi:hypothetical protein
MARSIEASAPHRYAPGNVLVWVGLAEPRDIFQDFDM